MDDAELEPVDILGTRGGSAVLAHSQIVTLVEATMGGRHSRMREARKTHSELLANEVLGLGDVLVLGPVEARAESAFVFDEVVVPRRVFLNWGGGEERERGEVIAEEGEGGEDGRVDEA